MRTMTKNMILIKAAEENKQQFCLFWIENDPEIIDTLVARGPGGGVRTYRKGCVDSRALENEDAHPRFSNPLWALDWMRANTGKKCLVTVECAKALRDDNNYVNCEI